MIFSVRLCVAAVCYGLCRGDSVSPQQQQDYIPNSLYKKLLYLIPRLCPEARINSDCVCPDGQQEDSPTIPWRSITDDKNNWMKDVLRLWRHTVFQQLEQMPQYQLCFSEWLHNELRVQRNEDVLSDTQRQEYQQWACLEFYLTRPEEQGGCGGDAKKLCTHLFNGIMDQPLSDLNLEKLNCSSGLSGAGTCLPDLLSRLQELVYEMEVSNLSGRCRRRADLWDFLFEIVSQRCSSSVSITSKLSLQRTLHGWNRVLLALPAVVFFKIKTEGGRTALDCNTLIEHINQHHRKVCPPASVLPCSITAHFLKGLLCAGVQCEHPAGEVNKVLSQMSITCPLFMVSAVRWWQQLSPLLFSLWARLRDGESLPKQLQLLTDCQRWACSLSQGLVIQMPPAAVLICAASLHGAYRGCEEQQQSFSDVLNALKPETEAKHQQVLVSLLFLCMKDYLSGLLYPQGKSFEKSKYFCSELLTVLVNSTDWLLIFRSNEQSRYHSVTLTSSDDCMQLMPWAICSLLLLQSAEFLQKALCCPGFLHNAILWYLSVLQLFLTGDTYTALPEKKVEPSQILKDTKQFVMSLISQAPPAALSSSQLRQLVCQCADLDPELAAALSVHLDPHSLSPEVDFLQW